MKKYTKSERLTALLLSVIMLSSCSGGETAKTAAKTAAASEQTSAASSETLLSEKTAVPTAAAVRGADFDSVYEVEDDGEAAAETTAQTTTAATAQETTAQTTTAETAQETTAQTTTAATAQETTAQTTTAETTQTAAAAATEATTQATTTTVATTETTTATEATTQTAAETASSETVQTSAAAVQDSPEAAAPAETAAPVAESSYNVIGENNILVSYQDGHYRGLMGCFGTYGLCDIWTAGVNGFAAALPGVNVYNMVVPISSEFYTPENLKSSFTASQLAKIQYVAGGLKGVTNVDAYSELAKHTAEPIYSRTDHHWLPLGAYYAAKAFSETADFDFPALSEYQGYQRGGYVGSMYTYSKDRHLLNDPEDFVLYTPPNDKKLKTVYYSTYFTGGYESDLFVTRDLSGYYCSFLGSDDRIAHIATDAANGRTLVIFKESFGNALVPFLTSGFENIYVCDIRYFNINAASFCKNVGATDLLFAVCTMTAAGTNGKYVSRILNQ